MKQGMQTDPKIDLFARSVPARAGRTERDSGTGREATPVSPVFRSRPSCFSCHAEVMQPWLESLLFLKGNRYERNP